MTRVLRGCLAITVLLLAWPAPLLAVDGVREINQTCAAGPGCFPGDTPGYWIDITAPGTYRLTSDLLAPADFEAIRINADHVTLDLNGFNVVSGGGTVNRNGTVRGFTGRGVWVLQSTGLDSSGARVIDVRALSNLVHGIDVDGIGALVRGCTASANGLNGISVVGNSSILQSVAFGNGTHGFTLGTGSGYGGNVLGNNNGPGVQVTGGIQTAINVCNAAVCP